MGVMKIAGYAGFFIMASIIISTIFSLLLVFQDNQNSSGNNALGPIVAFVLILIFILDFIFFIFFIYGFSKMGYYAESKLLRICSWAIITIIFVFLAIIIISLMMGSAKTNLITPMITGYASYGNENVISPTTALLGTTSQSDINYSAILLIVIFSMIFITFLFSLYLLFFIGLIDIGPQVRFARASGITGIFALVLIPIFSAISSFFIAVLSLSFAFSSSASNGPILTIAILFSFLNLLLIEILLLFLSLSLLNASKKFESGMSLYDNDNFGIYSSIEQ